MINKIRHIVYLSLFIGFLYFTVLNIQDGFVYRDWYILGGIIICICILEHLVKGLKPQPLAMQNLGTVEAAMQHLGTVEGVDYYWAAPGKFITPGVHYWDGTHHVPLRGQRIVNNPPPMDL